MRKIIHGVLVRMTMFYLLCGIIVREYKKVTKKNKELVAYAVREVAQICFGLCLFIGIFFLILALVNAIW